MKYRILILLALAIPALAQPAQKPAAPAATTTALKPPTQADIDALKAENAKLTDQLRQAGAIEAALQAQRNAAQDEAVVAKAQLALAQQGQQGAKP